MDQQDRDQDRRANMQQGARRVSRDKLSQQAGLRDKPPTCESKEAGGESTKRASAFQPRLALQELLRAGL